MKKSIKQVFNVFVCSVALIGMFFMYTEYEAYHFRPLSGPTSVVEPFNLSGVKVDAVVYSAGDSERYLNRDLLSEGYQPMQITIQNNTPNAFGLSQESVQAEMGSAESIANKMIVRSIPRQIAYKVASYFFWPFIIPSTIDTIVTFKSHAKMKRDLHAKSLKDGEEMILPYSTVHRIVYLKPGEVDENFQVHLRSGHAVQSFPVTING